MRLIDADAFEKWAWSNPDVVVDGDGYVLPYAASNFAEEHTIDAVPVVRCSQCEKWQKKDESWLCKSFGYCTECMMDCPADHFCSYGERKDGDG